jgi:DNA-binding HxlR family transcriptional regulator
LLEPGEPRAGIDLLRHRWAPQILHELEAGPLRYTDLKAALHKYERPDRRVHPKSFSAALRHLVAHGLVIRRTRATRPRTVVYALTDIGAGILAALAELEHFVDEHRDELEPDAGNGSTRPDAG